MLKAIIDQALIAQVLRFAAVGAAATVVHYSMLVGLVEFGGAKPIYATAAGYLCGAVLGYTLNRAHTFDHRPEYRSGLFKYLAMVAVGLSLNAVIFDRLTHAGFYYLYAQVMATGLVFIFDFSAARWGVFRAPKASQAATPRAEGSLNSADG